MQRCALLKSVFELNSKDIRDMNRALREIEPSLLKEMRKEIREIAKPINIQIRKNIPSQAPMSGMAIGNGRLRWFGDKKPDSTTISNRIKASGRSLTTPLVAIQLNSAATSMADMAGRVNKSRPVSREYVVRLRNGEIQKRRHRVTSQGQTMIRNLGSKASRYGWPALENKMSEVEREIDKVIEKYYRIANRGN
jgi:septum formation topological specificity factor MinE